MKIAFVVSQFPTLSESFIVQQIIGLLDLGHDVRIISFSKSDQSEIQKEIIQYRLTEKTTYLTLPAQKRRLRCKGFVGLMVCLFLNPQSIFRLLWSFKAAGQFSYQDLFLTHYFLREKFDVVHAHFGPNGLRTLCLKKMRMAIKHITTFHGYDVTVYVHQYGKDCYRELFRLGDCFTYNSQATRQKLVLLGCPEHKMAKLPMGVDLSKISFKERRLENNQTIHLLSVGRLVEMKGREFAIKAVSRLAEKYPIQYDIVGDGPFREELQALITELKAGDSIHLRGWVSSEQLEALYQDAHLFIHPSVTSSDGNQEGQGVVLLEAQAYGIPVIATRHGAFPDSLVDGQSGYLVPERDAKRLREAIETMIGQSALWPDFGACGRRFVEANFDIKKLNLDLERLYQE